MFKLSENAFAIRFTNIGLINQRLGNTSSPVRMYAPFSIAGGKVSKHDVTERVVWEATRDGVETSGTFFIRVPRKEYESNPEGYTASFRGALEFTESPWTATTIESKRYVYLTAYRPSMGLSTAFSMYPDDENPLGALLSEMDSIKIPEMDITRKQSMLIQSDILPEVFDNLDEALKGFDAETELTIPSFDPAVLIDESNESDPETFIHRYNNETRQDVYDVVYGYVRECETKMTASEQAIQRFAVNQTSSTSFGNYKPDEFDALAREVVFDSVGKHGVEVKGHMYSSRLGMQKSDVDSLLANNGELLACFRRVSLYPRMEMRAEYPTVSPEASETGEPYDHDVLFVYESEVPILVNYTEETREPVGLLPAGAVVDYKRVHRFDNLTVVECNVTTLDDATGPVNESDETLETIKYSMSSFIEQQKKTARELKKKQRTTAMQRVGALVAHGVYYA